MPTSAGPAQPPLPAMVFPPSGKFAIGMVVQCSSATSPWKMGTIETAGWMETLYPSSGATGLAAKLIPFKPDAEAGYIFHQPLGEAPDSLSGTTDMSFCAGLIADLNGQLQPVVGGLSKASSAIGIPTDAPIRKTVEAFKRFWDDTKVPQKHYLGAPRPIPGRTELQWPQDCAAAMWHVEELRRQGVDARICIDTAGVDGWPVGSANWFYLAGILSRCAGKGTPIEVEPCMGVSNVYAMSDSVPANQIEGGYRTNGVDAFYSGAGAWPSWSLKPEQIAGGVSIWLTGHGHFQGTEPWFPQPGHPDYAKYGDQRWTQVQRDAFLIGRLCIRARQGYRRFYLEPWQSVFKTAASARQLAEASVA